MAPHKVVQFFVAITVEPIGFLGFLALNFTRLAGVIFVLNAVCYQKYGTDPVCRNLSGNGTAEGEVQFETVQWTTWTIGAITIPSIMGNLILGAWSDQIGRKWNIIIGSSGLLVLIIGFELLGIFPGWPIWYLVIVAVSVGFTGALGMITTMCFTYLADTVVDPKFLTIRMSWYTAALTAGTIVAGVVGIFVADRIPMKYYNILSMVSVVILMIYTLIRIPQVPPAEMKKMCLAKHKLLSRDVHPTDDPPDQEMKDKIPDSFQDPNHPDQNHCETKKPCCLRFRDLGARVFHLLEEAVRTYLKPRPGYQRFYLIVSALTFIVYVSCMTELHNNVTALYTYHRPLSWTPGQLSIWRTVESLFTLLGKAAGVYVLKHFCHFEDTTLIIISQVSIIAESVIIGFSKTTWMMYVAASTATFAYMALPAYKSFIVQLVPHEEVGKAMAIFGTAQDMGLLIALLAFNNVYAATLHVMPGAVFFVVAGVMGICLIAMTIVHFMHKFDLKK